MLSPRQSTLYTAYPLAIALSLTTYTMTHMEDIEYPIRINKYLAHTNQSTRREADKLIAKKSVRINGRIAVLGDKVEKGDNVEVLKKGQSKKYEYILYYKPRGVVTHTSAEHDNDIETEREDSSVFPIGRLDKDSEGLILLTNDGRVTKKMLDPAFDHEKEYRVTVDKKIKQNVLQRIKKGVNIEGYVTKPGSAKILGETLIHITITEGKRHQIRRMLAALGYTTRTLRRVRIGNLQLKNLRPGEERRLTSEELKQFLLDLGL